MDTRLILASTSPYRRALLERLGLPFEVVAPGVDERPRDGEAPRDLVRRLAAAKAAAVPGPGLVIGSDQVAALDGEVLGKPGTHEHAVAQLRHLSGRRVEFLTAVTVCESESGRQETELAVTRVAFRVLDDATIENYLAREPAYDCAGGFKSEGLGITLVESIEDDDPTALVGLPLIALCRLLRSFGVEV